MAQKEKEERVLREKRERPLSTPLGTTSTNAMDTEEAQEFSKEIAEKAMERELKKQKYEQYQQIKPTSNYQVPKSITIPVPDLNKPRQEKEGRPTSVLSNFDVPLYEEMLGPKGMASPIKFTEALQNVDALKINPQGDSLMEALGFGPEKVEEKDPDFYMPDGQGKKLSESYQMFTNEQTPEGNPGVIVKLANLVKKYGTSIYLMDRKSGHLYVLDEKGYKQIEEKGLLYPSESLIIAGALDENRSNPFVMTRSSRLPETPAAESTRVPLKTSTDKREVKEKKELLTPDGLLEKEQTKWYQKELEEAEEDMVQAYLEKSKLEKEEVEIIRQRALKAQEEFEALEQK